MKRTLLLWAVALLFGNGAAFAQQTAPQTDEVRNVILMIGDGMGLGQVAAYMIENRYQPVSFDRAPYTALCKTYSANNRVTDSAASATAMATGHKTNNSFVGMLPDGTPVTNLTELARDKGLATGIVVTSHLMDATPSGFAVHVPNRHMGREIAEQYLGTNFDLLAGGGRSYFLPRENDDRDLLAQLQQQGYTYAATPEEFYAADRLPIIGLFADKYMDAAPQRGDYLLRATAHTLELLDRQNKGFFAMIEGSQIDGACHGNNPETMLAEMKDFDDAVNCAFDFADTHPGTLVVVVADHETGGLTILSNKKDFTASESGIEYKYSTTSHSGTPVVLYAYGAGASNFSGMMENTEIFRRIKALLID